MLYSILQVLLVGNKSDTKGDILYDSIYMKYPEQTNPLGQRTD